MDLSNDKQSDHWDPLLRACKADLGCKVPDWLAALDAITKALRKEGSINLVTRRSPTTKRGPNWRALIKHLQKDIFNNIGIGLVDLGRPATYSRPGLVKALLNTCSPSTATPKKPRYDEWDDISERPSVCYVAMTHFHFVEHRRHYGPDLFYALNYMMMETKKLVLLIQSEDKTFVELLPDNVSLPDLKMDTIELNAHP